MKKLLGIAIVLAVAACSSPTAPAAKVEKAQAQKANIECKSGYAIANRNGVEECVPVDGGQG